MKQCLYITQSYDEQIVNKNIFKILDDLQIQNEINPQMNVVIKPNLILPKSPNVSCTTHPQVIKAVALWLKEKGIKNITLAESSGGPYLKEYMMQVYKACKVYDLQDVLKLNDDFSSVTVHTREGFKNRTYNIIAPITKADYIINICKLKTHSMTMQSAGIKNIFGVIPGLEKPQLHYRWPNINDFANMIVELAQTVSPQLTIIDAIDSMEGNGPTGGSVKHTGLLLGSKDMYTQDYFAATLMKLDPCKVEILMNAKQKGLIHIEDMQLVGDEVPNDLTPFKIPDSKDLNFSNFFLPGAIGKAFAKIAATVLKSYPKLISEKCVGCGKCAESCPQKIITIKNNKAIFPKKNCISCFCCQEMCPLKAITVKKAL